MHVGDGEVQGEGRQGEARGCSGGGRERCPLGTIIMTRVAWGSNQGAAAED